MADKEVKIGLRTDLKGTGLKDAAAGLDKIDASAKTGARSMDAMEKEARDLERALGGLSPQSVEFEQTATQLGLVRKELSLASEKAEAFAVKAGGAAGSGRNFGAMIGQAGFQVQDFAVQVGGGTSALTAFAQQGSQLLGMFGPGGAVAGAALAIGAIAAKIISAREEAAASEEALERVNSLIKDLGEAFEQLDDQRGDESNIADNFREESEAIDAQTKAVLRNIEQLKRREEIAGKIREAQGELELLGLAARERRGEITTAEATKQRREIEERIERDRLMRAEVLADLGAQAHEARVKAAEQELIAANEAKMTAEATLATQREMRAAYEVLKAGAEAMQRLQQIQAAGGREAGYVGEPFIDIARRREEMDRLGPAVEATGFPAALGGNQGTLDLVTERLEALKKSLEALPPGAEDAIAAFEAAERKLADARQAMEDAADADRGDAATRGADALGEALERSQADYERTGQQAAEEIRRVFESWVASLGATAEAQRPAELIEQVRAALADGVQAGESDRILAMATEIARAVGSATAKTARGFSIIQSAVSSQDAQLNAVIRDVQRLDAQIKELAKQKR